MGVPMQDAKPTELVRVYKAERGYFFEGTVMVPLSEETREAMTDHLAVMREQLGGAQFANLQGDVPAALSERVQRAVPTRDELVAQVRAAFSNATPVMSMSTGYGNGHEPVAACAARVDVQRLDTGFAVRARLPLPAGHTEHDESDEAPGFAAPSDKIERMMGSMIKAVMRRIPGDKGDERVYAFQTLDEVCAFLSATL